MVYSRRHRWLSPTLRAGIGHREKYLRDLAAADPWSDDDRTGGNQTALLRRQGPCSRPGLNWIARSATLSPTGDRPALPGSSTSAMTASWSTLRKSLQVGRQYFHRSGQIRPGSAG